MNDDHSEFEQFLKENASDENHFQDPMKQICTGLFIGIGEGVYLFINKLLSVYIVSAIFLSLPFKLCKAIDNWWAN